MRRGGPLTRLLALVLTAGALAAAAPAPIKVLIFSGHNNHDWRTTTPFLRHALKVTGRFDVRVTEEPAGTPAKVLANYDVIVLDYQGPRWGAETEKAFEDFVKSGKGMVAVHAASYAFGGLEVLGDNHVKTGIVEPAWPAYGDMLGGSWKLPQSGHAPRHLFDVKLTDREHPITRGMEPAFKMHDELYHSLVMRPNVHVLATAFDDPNNGGTGKDEPMLWTVNYGQGRVFHTALGHDVAAMQEDGFITTFVRGTEWAATGEVTLPPRETARRNPNPVNLMVVTGGHDHDPSFYTVFEHDPDLLANINPHPVAYNGDLAQRYDVVVLYDMVADLSEKQKQNLRSFVESGKGLVVLHHAIADFQSWPWWYEEVVGGRYLLKPEGDRPASDYRHDQDMIVTPVGKHPILAGIGSFRIIDEGYKNKWLSPKVQILLKTEGGFDDGPLAWISPYEKSRVVYLQLGHDHKAHQNPVYQRLVKNAILWAAGRTAKD